MVSAAEVNSALSRTHLWSSTRMQMSRSSCWLLNLIKTLWSLAPEGVDSVRDRLRKVWDFCNFPFSVDQAGVCRMELHHTSCGYLAGPSALIQRVLVSCGGFFPWWRGSRLPCCWLLGSFHFLGGSRHVLACV